MLAYQWVYAEDWIHSMLVSVSVYCYLYTAVLLRSLRKARRTHWYQDPLHPVYVFIITMIYLVYCHWYQLIANPNRHFNFTTSQMWLTIKLTSFATYFYDMCIKHEKLTTSRVPYVSVELPSFLSYMGYMYCFTTILAGPSFTYPQYIFGIESPAPSSILYSTSYSILLLIQGIICYYLHALINPYYDTETLVSYKYQSTHSAWDKLTYYLLYTLSFRLLFYFGWKCFEGASVMAGFGYIPPSTPTKEPTATLIKEGKSNTYYQSCVDFIYHNPWSGVNNSSVLAYELYTPTTKCLKYWNISTQQWLQNCIYKRTNGSLAITYMFNAVWHGLDPGYFIFTGLLGLYTWVERMTGMVGCGNVVGSVDPGGGIKKYSWEWNVWMGLECIRYGISWTLTVIYISYAQLYFRVLTWENCVTIMYFTPYYEGLLWTAGAITVHRAVGMLQYTLLHKETSSYSHNSMKLD